MTTTERLMRAAIPDPRTGDIRMVDTRVPTPGPGEVLVDVHAAAMNRADLLHQRGKYGQRAFTPPDRPNIAGMEMAGRVVEVGATVDNAMVGDCVMAMCAGAYADYVAVPQEMLLPVPAGTSWPEAAALPMGILTEFEALVTLGGMSAGHCVLITGATSGVGLIGVQMARALGAEAVVATTRSPKANPLLHTLGAHAVANTDWELESLVGDSGVNIVVDHVGGNTVQTCIPFLRKGSAIVSVGRLGGRTAEIDLAALSSKRGRIVGTTWKSQGLPELADTAAAIQERILPLVEAGRIAAVIGASITFDELPTGYHRLAEHRSPGKIVVEFEH
ncbi:zinc-binding dehydrogenase [Rhodococcus oxybenzonivorans]|uniref:zinc-binding dehydrogenase n=1 Tax=Rhodococcus oxybenzonivorans TaxID=1990687 RepID=UPI002955A257|nr:zinc-binding dehydrogenase [Rhodococcus oxybenzonivorans]MDV7353745.1 zinc-binding dehydrogenase [Rhodococcus oxybenzonivorans]